MDAKENLRDILARPTPSPSLFVAFESITLRLLEEHLKESGKSLQPEVESDRGPGSLRHQVDGIVSEGVDALPGPTLVEIKFYRHSRVPLNRIDSVAMLAKRVQCNSVLLILANDLRITDRERIEHFWAEGSPDTPLQIWDINKLESIYAKHADAIAPLLKNVAEFRLRSVVEKPSTDWKQDRERRLRTLANDFRDGNMSIVLGAGVSIDSGLPDWTSLLDSLFVRLLTRDLAEDSEIRDDEIDSIVKRLKDVDDPSPLMTARYLRKGLNDSPSNVSDSFHPTVRNELYRRRKRKVRANTWVKALAKMTHPRRTGAKIKAVVTYNFDDLLEKELTETGDVFRSIFREGDIPSSDELPIYHVHGFLPEDSEPYDQLEESKLVFSEEGYHEIYVDSYHWSNLVQLNLYRESTCLFVGLSLTDPNLRRLLEISARRASNHRHFALMQRMDAASFISDKGKPVVRARKRSVEQFLENHHRIKEELFRELGVSIIWFNDYTEVPRLLKRIQE